MLELITIVSISVRRVKSIGHEFFDTIIGTLIFLSLGTNFSSHHSVSSPIKNMIFCLFFKRLFIYFSALLRNHFILLTFLLFAQVYVSRSLHIKKKFPNCTKKMIEIFKNSNQKLSYFKTRSLILF